MEQVSQSKSFGGTICVFEHQASSTKCPMRFSAFIPAHKQGTRLPALYWLSGLTCNEHNFMHKAGAQRRAAELGVVLIAPDTSPRGSDFPGEHDRYDFGSGAGFYLDATEAPWSENYRMGSYIAKELPELVNQHLPVDHKRCGIFGHSMGGHGALTIGLKNPDRFRSISAFAPICAPMQCPWGEQAFTGYLGSDRSTWAAYDATELVKSGAATDAHAKILIDQGSDDEFLEAQLHPHLLQEACQASSTELIYRLQDGYDHSYNFIATFVDDHLQFHLETLQA